MFVELANREIENLHCVETLEEQILDLTDELESRKLREDEQARHHQSEKQQIIDDIEGLRVCFNPFNSLYTGNPLTGTLANSEDPDEMQYNCWQFNIYYHDIIHAQLS